jgi:hypothetical protein
VTKKIITLARRRPGVSREAFARSWLSPGDPRPHGVRRARLAVVGSKPEWDGVEIGWGAGAFAGDDTVEESVSYVVEERTVSGADVLAERWATGDLGPVLIGLIEAAPGLSREDFRDYWWERHRPLAEQLVPSEVGPSAYVHNYVLDDGYRADGPRWAGIGEMYEVTFDLAKARG